MESIADLERCRGVYIVSRGEIGRTFAHFEANVVPVYIEDDELAKDRAY